MLDLQKEEARMVERVEEMFDMLQDLLTASSRKLVMYDAEMNGIRQEPGKKDGPQST